MTTVDSTVAALVNNNPIYQDEVQSIAKRFHKRGTMNQSVEPTDSAFMAQALNWLIARKLMYEEVQDYTIEIGSEEVEAAWIKFQNQFQSKAELNSFLNKCRNRILNNNRKLQLNRQRPVLYYNGTPEPLPLA